MEEEALCPAAPAFDVNTALQALTQNALVTQQQLHLLQQAITRSTEGRCNIKLQPYNASRPEDFARFEEAARNAIRANNWQWPTAGYAILGALEGQAIDIARSAKPDDYNSTDDFLVALKELFVSPAHKQKAMVEFMTRIQRSGEDITVYHGLLKDLFERAFEPQERSDRQLINQFIAGMSHVEANKQLHMEQAAGRLPMDYKKVLIMASGFISQCQLMTQEAQRRAVGGRVEMASSYQPGVLPQPWVQPTPPLPQLPPPSSPFPAPVPMEIGAVSGPARWCEFHKVTTHNTTECRARKAQGGPPRSRPVQPTQRPRAPQYQPSAAAPPRTQPAATQRPIRSDTCGLCGQRGHWRFQCPSKQNPTSTNMVLQTFDDHTASAAEALANPASERATLVACRDHLQGLMTTLNSRLTGAYEEN
jgi:hypothetical protein